MAIVTGDRYLNSLVKFLEKQAGPLIEGALVLKLNPVGLHYVQTRLESLSELEGLLVGAPVDYLRAYVSDLGDHRALEQLRRILRLLTSVKVVSALPLSFRDPTPLSLLPFGRLKVLELRGCDLSTSAARGLLELRHTLEKLICHNSTAALRHVFASRIADIRGSPQWNRLSFVSCACNDLILMDESLQLLPAVETLDLSRNKFTKVDNLSKCTRLKYLDLGFNHLRTIAAFGFEASRNIVKLVLRNNALITLRGIENLKSLEGLDVSYNIISSFSEIEILAGLPSLEFLWLEGNPLCSTRWYREQVFSFFHYPDKLKLDDKKISRKEFWKRQIIVTSRHKRPASFGFYLPAKDDSEGDTTNTKKKRHSRLACIESEEKATSTCSDQESVACENEMQNKEENVALVEDAEIVDLLNRIECMKKERSSQWLHEFKNWMDMDPQKFTDMSNNHVDMFRDLEFNTKNHPRQRHIGESSRYVSDQASADESVINMFETDSSVLDMASSIAHQSFDGFSEAAPKLLPVLNNKDIDRKLDKEELNSEDTKISEKARKHQFDSFPSSYDSTDDFVQSSTSVPPRSPPHYKEDILHRRHNLVEEFLQLSAHSYSVASSDSNSSSNDDDFDDIGAFVPRDDCSVFEDLVDTQVNPSPFHSKENLSGKSPNVSELMQNGEHLPNVSAEPTPYITPVNDDVDHLEHQEAELLELNNRAYKRKPKKRMVSLLGNHRETSFTSNGNVNNEHELIHISGFLEDMNTFVCRDGTENLSGKAEPLIKNNFNSSIANVGANEICRMCMMSNCMLQQESGFCEREVAVLLSSEDKLYVLDVDMTNDGSG